MSSIIRGFEGQLIEYDWSGHRWVALTISRRGTVDVWIASAEEKHGQARYAFTAHQDTNCDLDEALILSNRGTLDAMFELADEYLLSLKEGFDEGTTGDEIFHFKFGPLGIKASAIKAS